MFGGRFFNLLPSMALAALIPLHLVSSIVIQANICHLPPTAPTFTTASNSTTSSTQVISGTTSDDTDLTVSDNSTQQASLTSDSSGNFSLQVSLSLGSNSFSATATNSCGSINSTGSLVITRTAPPTPPPNPSGSGTSNGATPASITATSSSTAAANTTGVASSPPSSSGPKSTSSSPSLALLQLPTLASSPAGSKTTAKSIFIRGITTPGSSITISDNGKHVASLTAAPNGSFGVSVPLSLGRNIILITASYNGKTITQTITFIRIAAVLHPAYKSLLVVTILVIAVLLAIYYGLRRWLLGKLKGRKSSKPTVGKSGSSGAKS